MDGIQSARKHTCGTYLGLIALFVVKSHPLTVLGGIGDLLVINPLDRCTLQEGTDLEDQRNVSPGSTPARGFAFQSTNLVIGPESSFTSVWASRRSATSWSSNSSARGSQAEGTTISSKAHPQLLHWGSVVPPVLHGVVLQTSLEGAEVHETDLVLAFVANIGFC